jgi:hypothetical protein
MLERVKRKTYYIKRGGLGGCVCVFGRRDGYTKMREMEKKEHNKSIEADLLSASSSVANTQSVKKSAV